MDVKIRKPTKEDRKKAEDWPIWEKEASEFPWEYDEKESCLILEGDVEVANEEGKKFHFRAGDFVEFPQGLKCSWKIKKAVRKHYNFG